MPGRVLQVDVADGALVETDVPLVVLEAMKMQITVAEPGCSTGRTRPVALGSRMPPVLARSALQRNTVHRG